jgi:hypothetical protein
VERLGKTGKKTGKKKQENITEEDFKKFEKRLKKIGEE